MINKRWITLPVVYSRPFALKAVSWEILSSPLTVPYIYMGALCSVPKPLPHKAKGCGCKPDYEVLNDLQTIKMFWQATVDLLVMKYVKKMAQKQMNEKVWNVLWGGLNSKLDKFNFDWEAWWLVRETGRRFVLYLRSTRVIGLEN